MGMDVRGVFNTTLSLFGKVSFFIIKFSLVVEFFLNTFFDLPFTEPEHDW